MLLSFIYWFVLAPRCKVLSCGKTLRETSWCPEKNPFSSSNGNAKDGNDVQDANETYSTTQNKSNSTPIQHSTRDAWIVTNVLILYIFNPNIMKMSLQMLQKETICGVEYWSRDDTVDFSSNIHQTWIMTVAVPSLLLYGLVFNLLAVLYIGRHHDRQTNKKLMFRFGLLYSGFAPDYWWYELILYLRKLTIIMIVTFASSNAQQLHFALGTLIVLLYFQEHIMPFENSKGTVAEKLINKKLHRLESCSLLVLISMIWTGVFFVIGCNDNDGVCSFLGVAVLGGNVVFIILCAAFFLQAFDKKHHLSEKMSKLTHAFSSSALVIVDVNEDNEHESTEASTSSAAASDDAEFSWTPRLNGGEIRINPLNSGNTREGFVQKRRSTVVHGRVNDVEEETTTPNMVEMIALSKGPSSASVKIDEDDDDEDSLPRSREERLKVVLQKR